MIYSVFVSPQFNPEENEQVIYNAFSSIESDSTIDFPFSTPRKFLESAKPILERLGIVYTLNKFQYDAGTVCFYKDEWDIVKNASSRN